MFFGSRVPGPVGESKRIRDPLTVGGGANKGRDGKEKKGWRGGDEGKGEKGKGSCVPIEVSRSRRLQSAVYVHEVRLAACCYVILLPS